MTGLFGGDMASDGLRDERGLTPRENEILRLVGEGCSNREIAKLLGITKSTVRFHLNEIHARLGSGGDRDMLRDEPEAAGMRSIIGTMVGFGAAVAIGIGAVVFVVENTGDGKADGDAPIVVSEQPLDCAVEVLDGGGTGEMTCEPAPLSRPLREPTLFR